MKSECKSKCSQTFVPDVACLQTGVHGATDPSTVPVVPHSVPAVTLAPHQWWSSAIGIAATERLTRMAYTLKKPTKPSMATTCRLPHPGDSIVMRSSDRSFRNLHVRAGCSTCHSRPLSPLACSTHRHCTITAHLVTLTTPPSRSPHSLVDAVHSQTQRISQLRTRSHHAHLVVTTPTGSVRAGVATMPAASGGPLAIARPLGFDVFCSVLFALTPPNKSEVPRRAEGSLGPRGLCCSHSLRRRAL